MSGRFEGKVVFITGVARGQGRSHALAFAREGASIVGLDICRQIDVSYDMATEEDLATTVGMVEELDRQIVARVADVRDAEAVAAIAEEGMQKFGRLDVVCANAGIGVNQHADSWELTREHWQDSIDINLTGPWTTVRATVPHMIETGPGGSVIFTTSLLGLKGMPNVSNYTAAKHGLTGLMKSLAIELAPHRLRANAVAPGNTLTRALDNDAGYRAFRPDLEKPTRDDFFEACLLFNTFPEPWAQPEDITAAVLWLASEEARFVTGTSVPVDLGAMLK
jgi:(+)-trans-carveol dehydrogenase/(-)-trans-carveol dehydrogenase